MKISAAVVEYFQKISYKEWNPAGCLRHVANNCPNVTSQCKEEVRNEIKRQLRFIENHMSISQYARNKAGSFSASFEAEKIATIFQYDTKDEDGNQATERSENDATTKRSPHRASGAYRKSLPVGQT